MTCTKAVIFDYIGTLINCKGYTMEASRDNLYTALVNEGFNVGKDKFLTAYNEAHEKYRIIRFEQLREVTNSVWVAEALHNLSFKVAADDPRIKAALSIFFKSYIDSFELREGAKKLIKQALQQYKIGLISNFTYAPVIYASLRYVGINDLFNAIIVSEEIGWRKPSSHIFQHALDKLGVEANEAIYIGDSPLEDIKGAKEAGLRTIFVVSQFYTLKDLSESKQKPEFIAKNLPSIAKKLMMKSVPKEVRRTKKKEREN